jgi:exosortase
MDISVKSEKTHVCQKEKWSDIGIHNYIKIIIIGSLFFYVFYREINNIVYSWITDSSWSHGFLIPLFSLYFINQHKKEIINLHSSPNYLGLIFMLVSIFLYIFNLISPSGWAYFRSLSIIMAIGSIVFLLGGWQMIRYTWLPISFLIFAVPLPGRFYRGITIPMRQLAASIAAALLNIVSDMEATARGVVIDIMYKGNPIEPSLDVAESCS